MSPLRGVVFDLDGTLIDSALDFDQIRREMRLPTGMPVLEAIASLPRSRATQCWRILERHETAGAQRATLMPGVQELTAELDRRKVAQGVVTRNSRRLTDQVLRRCGLAFRPVICREDAPIKPHPEAIWMACRVWGIPPTEAVMIGDFRHDIEAGRRAGARTLLVLNGRPAETLPWAADADDVVDTLRDAAGVLFPPA